MKAKKLNILVLILFTFDLSAKNRTITRIMLESLQNVYESAFVRARDFKDVNSDPGNIHYVVLSSFKDVDQLEAHLAVWNEFINNFHKNFRDTAFQNKIKCFFVNSDENMPGCFDLSIAQLNNKINKFLKSLISQRVAFEQKVLNLTENYYQTYINFKNYFEKSLANSQQLLYEIYTIPLTRDRKIKQYLEYLIGKPKNKRSKGENGLFENIVNKIYYDFQLNKESQINSINYYANKTFLDQNINLKRSNLEFINNWNVTVNYISQFSSFAIKLDRELLKYKKLECLVEQPNSNCESIRDINKNIIDNIKSLKSPVSGQLDNFIFDTRNMINKSTEVLKIKLNTKDAQDIQDVLNYLLLTFEKIVYKIQEDFKVKELDKWS